MVSCSKFFGEDRNAEKGYTEPISPDYRVLVNGVLLTKENAMIETTGVDSLFYNGEEIML